MLTFMTAAFEPGGMTCVRGRNSERLFSLLTLEIVRDTLIEQSIAGKLRKSLEK